MRLILPLLLMTTLSFGQGKSILLDGVEHLAYPVPEAAVIDFWGRKGITSKDLVLDLKTEVGYLKTKIEFKDMIISNQTSAQEEYRAMVARSAQESQRLLAENLSLREERDDYKEKARKRGEKLWTFTGALGLAIGTFIATKL